MVAIVVFHRLGALITVGPVLVLCAVCSIVFGTVAVIALVYGEYISDEPGFGYYMVLLDLASGLLVLLLSICIMYGDIVYL